MNDFLDHLFVLGIGEGIDQGNGNNFDALGDQAVDDRFRAGFVQRLYDLAPSIHSFIDDEAKIAFDQWCRFFPMKVIKARHAKVSDFQHVAESLRADQAGLGSLVLQDCVRRHRRAVQDFQNIGTREAVGFKNLG